VRSTGIEVFHEVWCHRRASKAEVSWREARDETLLRFFLLPASSLVLSRCCSPLIPGDMQHDSRRRLKMTLHDSSAPACPLPAPRSSRSSSSSSPARAPAISFSEMFILRSTCTISSLSACSSSVSSRHFIRTVRLLASLARSPSPLRALTLLTPTSLQAPPSSA
jgi:hypothetical protein